MVLESIGARVLDDCVCMYDGTQNLSSGCSQVSKCSSPRYAHTKYATHAVDHRRQMRKYMRTLAQLVSICITKETAKKERNRTRARV